MNSKEVGTQFRDSLGLHESVSHSVTGFAAGKAAVRLVVSGIKSLWLLLREILGGCIEKIVQQISVFMSVVNTSKEPALS
jgi:hypothetical protein